MLTNNTLIMKSIRLTLVLCALFIFSTGLMAQSSQATIGKSGAVLLSDSTPLQEAYSLDASTFNFDNADEARVYFQAVNTNLVFYRPVLNNGVVMVYLQLTKEPNWTKEDWNTYLLSNKVLTTETSHSTSK